MQSPLLRASSACTLACSLAHTLASCHSACGARAQLAPQVQFWLDAAHVDIGFSVTRDLPGSGGDDDDAAGEALAFYETGGECGAAELRLDEDEVTFAKLEADQMEPWTAAIRVPLPGLWRIEWDNSHSWLTEKRLSYRVQLTESVTPDEVVPEDEVKEVAAAAAAAAAAAVQEVQAPVPAVPPAAEPTATGLPAPTVVPAPEPEPAAAAAAAAAASPPQQQQQGSSAAQRLPVLASASPRLRRLARVPGSQALLAPESGTAQWRAAWDVTADAPGE